MQNLVNLYVCLVSTSFWETHGRRVHRLFERVGEIDKSEAFTFGAAHRSDARAEPLNLLKTLAVILAASNPASGFSGGPPLELAGQSFVKKPWPVIGSRFAASGLQSRGTQLFMSGRNGALVKTSTWPPEVEGLGLAFDQLADYSFTDYLSLKPFELISRALDGDLAAIAGGPLFRLLEEYKKDNGPIYKLSFAGFQEFLVVSDPVIARHILRDNAENYDKGMLTEILEDVMGQGLIPARPEVWKPRRTAIAPGFHKRWLNAMLKTFVEANGPLLAKLDRTSDSGEPLAMETEFSSVTLDIIGKAVFNYEFGSVTNESPVVKAVYGALQEAERRSTSVLPYWKVPFANKVLDNLKSFEDDMGTLNNVLDNLIVEALDTQNQADEEDLLNRDYENMDNPSLLRFLVDMRGEESSSIQLRDDLMTMLIAGHETSAAVLTWTVYELSQNPELYSQVRAEIDKVVGSRTPTYEDIQNLELVRLCVAETLRMYPEPPLLIRRSIKGDVLPEGGAARETVIPAGSDIIISTWNLHRSPDFWEDPEVYNPMRFLKPYKNPQQAAWSGYKPPSGGLYPSELQSDYAFMPFGGGQRRCVGDQFAVMESVVTLSLILQRFDLALACHPKDVGMRTGATIHTENGLPMRVTKRKIEQSKT